jgi:hypothetical protein
VVSRGRVVGRGENFFPPLGGHLPQGLPLQPLLEIVRVHLIIFRQSPLTAHLQQIARVCLLPGEIEQKREQRLRVFIV